MLKKNIWLVALCLFLFLNNFAKADRYIKIACIDFAKIFKKYSATAKIRKKLRDLRNKILKKVNNDRNEIKKIKLFLKRNSSRLTELERRWYYSEIEIRKAKLKEEIIYYKRRLKRIEKKLTLPYITEIYLAAKKIKDKFGFSIVLHKNKFIYTEAKYDLTGYVIQYLERKLRGYYRE